MDLSILIPGIRTELWKNVYDSVMESFDGSWEIVFVGPYDPPDELKDINNIQFIKDWGSPIRCRQIALVNARGRWICYAADDVTFCKDSLTKAFAKLKKSYMDKNTVIVGKYIEGKQHKQHIYAAEGPSMESDMYYMLHAHNGLKDVLQYIPKNYMLVNTGLISRELMRHVGGFDCYFEACAMACVDLSIRIQNYHARLHLLDDPLFTSTHAPMKQGDHAPIHNAQLQHDVHWFGYIYNQPECINRITVPIDRWKNSPDKWERRFGCE